MYRCPFLPTEAPPTGRVYAPLSRALYFSFVVPWGVNSRPPFAPALFVGLVATRAASPRLLRASFTLSVSQVLSKPFFPPPLFPTRQHTPAPSFPSHHHSIPFQPAVLTRDGLSPTHQPRPRLVEGQAAGGHGLDGHWFRSYCRGAGKTGVRCVLSGHAARDDRRRHGDTDVCSHFHCAR